MDVNLRSAVNFGEMHRKNPQASAFYDRCTPEQRSAILLVGGDKAGKWYKLYRNAIPQAERIYEQWIRQSEKG